mmetsp:Transcript_6489/g.11393  ORF Transcript_6489/g.11393 Transcript_6489/m.11393 type:complete len:526 (+) Transcript_6489:363-1940(+)
MERLEFLCSGCSEQLAPLELLEARKDNDDAWELGFRNIFAKYEAGVVEGTTVRVKRLEEAEENERGMLIVACLHCEDCDREVGKVHLGSNGLEQLRFKSWRARYNPDRGYKWSSVALNVRGLSSYLRELARGGLKINHSNKMQQEQQLLQQQLLQQQQQQQEQANTKASSDTSDDEDYSSEDDEDLSDESLMRLEERLQKAREANAQQLEALRASYQRLDLSTASDLRAKESIPDTKKLAGASPLYADQRACSLCHEKVRPDGMDIMCKNLHSICGSCLQPFIDSICDGDLTGVCDDGEHLLCSECEDMIPISQVREPAFQTRLFLASQRKRENLIVRQVEEEAKRQAEEEEEAKRQAEEEAKRQAEEEEEARRQAEEEEEARRQAEEEFQRAQTHIHHIEDSILLTCCPNSHPFFDFDGGFALNCSTCGCYFCAWCLTECQSIEETNIHILCCDHKSPDSFGVAGTDDEFQSSCQMRYQQRFRTYWSSAAVQNESAGVKRLILRRMMQAHQDLLEPELQRLRIP